MDVIATWMYTTPPGEDVLHLQTGAKSSDVRTRNFYWRCVALLFESSARQHPDSRHLLFLNERPPAAIDGISMDALLEQYRVEIIELPNITRPPAGYWRAWSSQFVVLDVLDWLADHVNGDDAVFVLDSDMIFNRPITEPLHASLSQNGALLYTIPYSEDHNINGLTRRELEQISQELEPERPMGEYRYHGGEFVCARGEQVRRIAEAARKGFAQCLDRHARGAAKFHEEAHLLSHAYRVLGYRPLTGNPYVKRIWTDRSVYSNIDGNEDSLILWHLPAEKKRGFVNVFRSYRRVGERYELGSRDFARAYRLQESALQLPRRLVRQAARHIYRRVFVPAGST